MFNIGEEVICVDNSVGWHSGESCNLVKGKTYIVLAHCPCYDVCDCIMVRPDYTAWCSERFRRPQVDTELRLVCSKVDA
jgi:hypothetical protein